MKKLLLTPDENGICLLHGIVVLSFLLLMLGIAGGIERMLISL